MNSTIYIFGNMQNGYTQYPDDETTHEIFQNFALNAKAPTQLAVHRDGSLMYYGYIRKLEGEQYIGLCVLLNNVMLTNVSSLFALYESTIEMLAEKGCLIKFDTRGNLVANAQHLYMSKTEVESVAAWLQEKVEEYEDATTSIPPVDYAVASTAVKVFSHQDDVQTIITSTHTNGYTYILKAEDYNTVNLDSYQGVLASVTKENEELQRQIQRLEAEKRQQLRLQEEERERLRQRERQLTTQAAVIHAPSQTDTQAAPFLMTPHPTLSIGEAYNLFWKRYANFSGRSRRSEYWWATTINTVIMVIMYVMVFAGYSQSSSGYYGSYSSSSNSALGTFGIILFIIFSLATFIPTLAVSVRRLHDTGRSGWYLLLGLIPIVNYVGGIVLLVFDCQDSQLGVNKWGVSPKYDPY